jgi:hypothetical protein
VRPMRNDELTNEPRMRRHKCHTRAPHAQVHAPPAKLQLVCPPKPVNHGGSPCSCSKCQPKLQMGNGRGMRG